MTTTLVALLMSATVLLIYELRSHRQTWLQDLRTQAELVARASGPALAFEDPRAAADNLALLRLRPQIEGAAIYDRGGRLFASYAAPGQARPTDGAGPGAGAGPGTGPAHEFDGNRLSLREPIVVHGEPAGTMVLQARYDVVPRLLDYLAILCAVTLASLALAALIARRLQSTITDPVVAVADVAREVMAQRNYALRAPRTTDDELGLLSDAFNDMLRVLGGQAAELQANDRRKDEFLATLAHELRNPLAPVSTALAILERGDADASTQQRLVAMMQRQMQQFVRLIDDLMEVSRISTGRPELRIERLDLVQVVRGAVESVTPVLLERRHLLAVQWPAPKWIEGDRTRLAQVFVNLLANAAKYTDPGGRIDLAFGEDDGAVWVRIADNGIGIAAEMQGEVFEMFVQADRSLARGRSGLGVGLSLARQLVELHGGTLQLESAGLGHGSAFTVRLPPAGAAVAKADAVAAAPRAERPAPEPVPATDAAAAARRVLVADDNRDFADSLAAVLKGAGHEVEVTYDGHAALRAAVDAGRPPDVGLFDIGMPGIDGYALAQAVRSHPDGHRCLLVAITGWGQQSDEDRARAAGFDEHLVKPVDLDALLGLLALPPRNDSPPR